MRLEVEEHRLVVALDADVETVGELSVHFAALREQVSRRGACSIRLSTGQAALASVSSSKYSRVCKWMLMPRANSETLMCGAIGTPWALRTTPA